MYSHGVALDLTEMAKAREVAKLSQVEAAKKAGMSVQAWHRIESGSHVNISLGTLDKIAAALGVEARNLLKT